MFLFQILLAFSHFWLVVHLLNICSSSATLEQNVHVSCDRILLFSNEKFKHKVNF